MGRVMIDVLLVMGLVLGTPARSTGLLLPA